MRIEEKNGELNIAEFSEFDAYRIASKIENDGIEFYRKLLSGARNSELEEALGFLLQEEKNHLKFFEQSLSKIRENKEDTGEDSDLLSSIDYGIFMPYKEIDDLEKALFDQIKTLKLGLIIERNSIRFYKACREKLREQQVKDEILKIIEEENKHKELIEQLLKNLG